MSMRYLKKNIVLEKKEESDDNIKLRNVSNFIEKRFKNEKLNPIYVYWVAKIFKLEKIIFVSKIEMSEAAKDVIHTYIKIEDKYFDQTGFYDKEDIIKEFDLDEYNFKDLVYNGSLTDLQDVIKTKELKMSDKQLKELQSIVLSIKK